VAGAPPPAIFHQCTPTQWDDWYKLVTDLGEGAEPFELLVTLVLECSTWSAGGARMQVTARGAGPRWRRSASAGSGAVTGVRCGRSWSSA
jgi:hypothetical protein